MNIDYVKNAARNIPLTPAQKLLNVTIVGFQRGGYEMPISSVNLDEETQAISKRVGNFSEFVRECLRRWNAHDTATHVHPTETPMCYPDSKKGCCLICWPQGRPNKADWFYFRDSGRNGGDYAVKWIEEKAKESNISPEFPIPKTEDFKKSRDVEKIGLYARFKRFFRPG